MRTRCYQPSDFRPVFKLINAAAETDRTRRISEQALRSELASPAAYEETAVAVDSSGNPVGFSWWEVSDEPARVGVQGWVHPQYRGQGAGSALLEAVETYARQRFNVPVNVMMRTYDDIPDAQALAQSSGYSQVRKFYVMHTSLVGQTYERPIPPGIEIRAFQSAELEQLVAADNDIFAEHWGTLPRSVEMWRHHMIELRQHDPTLWLIAWAGDRIVGECLCNASQEAGPTDGWVSVVGVRKDWRGTGVAQAVMAQGLTALQWTGYTSASLYVDAENIAAFRLYRSLGMEVTRTRLHYAKTITTG